MELEWRMKSTSVNENMKKKLWRHSVIDSFCCSHITVVIVNYALVTKLWGPCGCVVCGKVVGWSTDKGNYLLSWSSSGAAYLNALRKSVVKFCLVWCECCCVCVYSPSHSPKPSHRPPPSMPSVPSRPAPFRPPSASSSRPTGYTAGTGGGLHVPLVPTWVQASPVATS